MNKEEYRREKLQQEIAEDEYYEAHKREFEVTFTGVLYVEALDKDEAIQKAQDNPDLFEFVEKWEAEE